MRASTASGLPSDADGHDLQLGAFALVAVAPHEDLRGDSRVLPDLIRRDHADDGHVAADVFVADRDDVDGHFHSAVGPRDRVGPIGVAGAAVGEDDHGLRRGLAEPVRETFERGTQERVGIGRGRGRLGRA